MKSAFSRRTGAFQSPVRFFSGQSSPRKTAAGSRLTRILWLAVAAMIALLGEGSWAWAQPPVHYFHSSSMPPGVVGAGQLMRGGPLPGYFQPVEIRVPDGASIGLTISGQYEKPAHGTVLAGMLIGHVYRFKVTGIPRHEGFEVFPTIEVINRLYPPRGLENHFPIPIDITAEELELALSGRFVVRVIYLEDPNLAVPVATDGKRQLYYEVRSDEDPLHAADRLGRPMAILRMGSRVPDEATASNGFNYGSPPLMQLQKPPALPDPKSGLEPPIAPPPGAQGRAIPRIDGAAHHRQRTDAPPMQWWR